MGNRRIIYIIKIGASHGVIFRWIFFNVALAFLSIFISPKIALKPTYYVKQETLPNRTINLRKIRRTLANYRPEHYESSFYFHENWKNQTVQPPLADIDMNSLIEYIFSPALQLYREHPEFFILRNAVIKPPKTRQYPVYLEDGSFLDVHPQYKKGKVIQATINTSYAFRYVVAVPYLWQASFGHILIDGMFGYMNIPHWVWSLNPVVVISAGESMLEDHFAAIGLSDIKILTTTNYVFGEYIFMAKDKLEWCGVGSMLFPTLKAKFNEYYGTKNIKPTEYIFLNKEPTKPRHFTNFDEIILILRNMTGYDWKQWKLQYKPRINLQEQWHQ